MNYIVLGDNVDYHTIAFSGFNTTGYSMYIPGIDSKSKILQFLYKVHISTAYNIRLPFKNIWFPLYFRNVPVNKPLCFIILSRTYQVFGESIINYIKKTYKDCRIVCLFQDLVATHETINIEKLKKKTDLIVTFDEGDAIKYGFFLFPLIYSCIKNEGDDDIKFDIYFVGKCKNRYEKIVKTYAELCKLGLKCDFNIIGTPKNKNKVNGINYINRMSYWENIEHIRQSKCIFEIVQKGGTSSTLRLNETIFFEKKLFTNNKNIKKSHFYDPSFIYCFDDCCNYEVKKFINKPVCFEYQVLKSCFTPEAFIEFINQRFEEKS